jgi:hypothetical protein
MEIRMLQKIAIIFLIILGIFFLSSSQGYADIFNFNEMLRRAQEEVDKKTPKKETDLEPRGIHQPRPTTFFASPILGDKSRHIYHQVNCPGYQYVPPENRVPFYSIQQAEDAGFKRAEGFH